MFEVGHSLHGALNNGKADLLALIPMPLVHLAHSESEFPGDVVDEVSLPLGILLKLVF